MSSNDYEANVYGPGQPRLNFRFSHGNLVDTAAIALALYKQGDFHLFRQGQPIAQAEYLTALRAAPPGFVFPLEENQAPQLLPYTNKHRQDWAMQPLADREIPILTFDLDGWTAKVTHLFHDDNFYQYARLIAPDGRVWLGCSGYLEDWYISRELPESCLRQMESIFGVDPETLTRQY